MTQMMSLFRLVSDDIIVVIDDAIVVVVDDVSIVVINYVTGGSLR